MQLKNNSILITHYNKLKNLNELDQRLRSNMLTNQEVESMYDKKYNISEFDIYKYITAYDKIVGSLGCDKYKLSEGITNDINKYNNILIDLFYMNIPSDIIEQHPISIVFGIKQTRYGEIISLTKSEKRDGLFRYDYEANSSC